MDVALIATLGLALAGSTAPALVQSPTPADVIARPAQMTECDARAAPQQPCVAATPSAAPRRRAVPLTIERMPPSIAPAAPIDRPQPPAPARSTASTSPLPLLGCDGGACRDAAGIRHEGGVGNATLDPNGRLCHRDGAWLQCF